MTRRIKFDPLTSGATKRKRVESADIRYGGEPCRAALWAVFIVAVLHHFVEQDPRLIWAFEVSEELIIGTGLNLCSERDP